MAAWKHRLVVVGDSLSQGFMSGAIHRTDISYPVWVADALGVRDEFVVPDFSGEGGLPLNLERTLKRLGKDFGNRVNWWEVVPALAVLHRLLDRTEDYWERGKGAQFDPERQFHHNLSVWGFEVADAFTVTEGVCRRAIPKPRDNWLTSKQVPEMAMYRTAQRVLNPSFSAERIEWHQLRVARALADDGGIENLVVFLGANNALGTVTSLSIRHSEDQDLWRMPHQRTCNLYLPQHFEELYTRLADVVESVGAQRVFVCTVPHVTVPPVTRGVSPSTPDDPLDDRGYYEYYTRPWVWDKSFDKNRHPHLTREDAHQIDEFIDAYNDTIRRTAKKRKWRVVDTCQLLDDLAFRRQGGQPKDVFPEELKEALRRSQRLSYLVEANGQVRLDSRYLRCQSNNPATQITQGGLFSLDGIHPTTIAYGLVADKIVREMKRAQVSFPNAGGVDWDTIVAADTLINDPPLMLTQLRDTMAMLDKRGLLSSILETLQ